MRSGHYCRLAVWNNDTIFAPTVPFAEANSRVENHGHQTHAAKRCRNTQNREGYEDIMKLSAYYIVMPLVDQ